MGMGVSIGSGASLPQPPSTGMTLTMRETFSTLGTLNSGNLDQFSSMSGNMYARPAGPRVGPASAASWANGGWSGRVSVQDIGSTIVYGAYDFHTSAPTQTCGTWGAWFRFAGSNGSTSPMRCLELYDTGPTLVLSAAVQLTSSGASTLTFTGQDTYGTGSQTIGNLNQWIWVQLVWNVPGSGTKTFSIYVQPLGGTYTLVGTGTTASAITAMGSCRVTTHQTSSWWGAVGDPSLYAVDTLAHAAVYPNDITTPAEGTNNWFVDPVNGNDSNSGYSSSSAWQTFAKAATEVANGTALGSYLLWSDQTNTQQTAASITTKALGDTLWGKIKSGTVTPRGDQLNFINGTTYVLPAANAGLTSLISMPPGGSIFIAPGSNVAATLVLTGAVWTRPNAGTYPNVWQYTGTNLEDSITVENGIMLTPVAAANLAAAEPTLNTTAGSCYADAAGVYIHTLAGGNPNSDGLARYCGVRVSAAGAGTVGSIFQITDGQAFGGGTISAGPCCWMPTGNVGTDTAQYLIFSGDSVAVLSNLTLDGGTKHSVAQLSIGATGFFARWNITFKNGNTVGGDWSTDVPFCGLASGSATLFCIWDTCTTTPGAAFFNPGSAPSDDQTKVFQLMHSGGTASNICCGFEYVNCNLVGVTSPFLIANNSTVYSNSTMGALGISGTVGVTATQCTFNCPIVTSGVGASFTATNCIFVDKLGLNWGGVVGGGEGQASGTYVFNSCTIDLSTFAFGVNGNALYGAKAGGISSTQTYNNCAIIANASATLACIWNGNGRTDNVGTFAFNNCAVLGYTNPLLLINYYNGNTTANYAYTDMTAAGYVRSSVNSASVGLNSASNYAVQAGSPVIDIAAVQANAADYTGTIFAVRSDAGARDSNAFFSPQKSSPSIYYRTDLSVLSTDGAVSVAAGSSQFISGALGTPLPTTGCGFSMWIKPTGTQGNGSVPLALFTGVSNLSLYLSFNATNQLFIGQNTGTVITTASASTACPSGTWTHVAVGVSGTTASLYINGAFVTSGTLGAFSGGTSVLANLFLGAAGTAFGGYITGAIASVGLYNAASTAGQITSLYAAGAGVNYHNLPPSAAANLYEWWDLFAQGGTSRVGRILSTALAETNGPCPLVAGVASSLPFYAGDPTTSIGDLSLNADNATQAIAPDRSQYQLSVVNSLPALKFIGSPVLYNYGSSVNLGTVHTITHVLYNWSAGIVLGGAAGSNSLYYNSGTLQYSAGAGNSVSVSFTPSASTAYIISVVRNGTSVSFYVNGAQQGTTQTLASNTALTLSTIGGNSGGGFNFIGDLLTAVAYPSVVSWSSLHTYFDSIYSIY
jgi:hypothetical protein